MALCVSSEFESEFDLKSVKVVFVSYFRGVDNFLHIARPCIPVCKAQIGFTILFCPGYSSTNCQGKTTFVIGRRIILRMTGYLIVSSSLAICIRPPPLEKYKWSRFPVKHEMFVFYKKQEYMSAQ